jgi:hypothetical protein
MIIITLTANNLNIVSIPTAGVLSRGEARIHQKIYKNNGLAVGADVGLFENFQFGVAYGVEHLIGDRDPNWHNKIDFHGRYRIINETIGFPAIAVGIDTQGHGHYDKRVKRYEIKSKGAYVVLSKNFAFMGLMGFDVGTNYTFETNDKNGRKLDAFAGMYKTIGDDLTVFLDYSAGFNDREKGDLHSGLGRGYLNSGIQMRFSDNLSMKFLMYDMLQNRRSSSKYFDRALLIDYRWFF